METNIGNNSNEFRCKICNKIYANKSGIWKHNNKYHMGKTSNDNTLDNHQLS